MQTYDQNITDALQRYIHGVFTLQYCPQTKNIIIYYYEVIICGFLNGNNGDHRGAGSRNSGDEKNSHFSSVTLLSRILLLPPIYKPGLNLPFALNYNL